MYIYIVTEPNFIDMAKQKGIIKLTGTIGDINFYYRKGVPVARKAGGGFNSEAIKKSPKMKRVRENSSEFGLCSRAKKVFKNSLHPFLIHYKDPTLHGRMMRLFQEIKVCDVLSERGKRTVGNGLKSDAGRKLLLDFRITPKRDVASSLMGKITFDKDNYICRISEFNMEQFKFYGNASHFELRFGIVRMDFDTLSATTYMAKSRVIGKDFDSSTIALRSKDIPTEGGIKFAFLGICFYQEVSGQLEVLKAESATGLQLLKIF